jgi:hypothetical protein
VHHHLGQLDRLEALLVVEEVRSQRRADAGEDAEL